MAAPVIGTQISPRHSFIMNATISGLIFAAATIRSPSFSRSSSSITTTGRPAAIASIALAMESIRQVGPLATPAGCLDATG